MTTYNKDTTAHTTKHQLVADSPRRQLWRLDRAQHFMTAAALIVLAGLLLAGLLLWTRP